MLHLAAYANHAEIIRFYLLQYQNQEKINFLLESSEIEGNFPSNMSYNENIQKMFYEYEEMNLNFN